MKKIFVLLIVGTMMIAEIACAQDEAKDGIDAVETCLAMGKMQCWENSPWSSEPNVLAKEEPTDKCPAGNETESEKTIKKEYRPHLGYGLAIGLYNPTSSEVRGLFGDNRIRFGLRPFPLEIPKRWRINFDLSYYSMDNGTDDVRLIPITVGVLKGVGERKQAKTYMAINAGPYYGKLNAPSIMTHERAWRLGANATIGVLFRDKLSIEARYEWLEELGGLDFSAFTISVAYKIFTLRM